MNWRLALNPIVVVGHLKQEWLYRSYLNNEQSARNFALDYLPKPVSDPVLDFGCGRGRHVAVLNNLGCDVTGVDRAYSKWWNNIKPRSNKVNFKWGEYTLNDFKDKQFNLCLCFLVLYLIDDDEWTLSQFHRILRPDGWLVLQVPNAKNPWTKRTGRFLNDVEPIKRYYTAESITEKLERAGFRVERIWYEKYYPAKHLKAVNAALALLPAFVDKWLANRLPERDRGVINVWARKLPE